MTVTCAGLGPGGIIQLCHATKSQTCITKIPPVWALTKSGLMTLRDDYTKGWTMSLPHLSPCNGWVHNLIHIHINSAALDAFGASNAACKPPSMLQPGPFLVWFSTSEMSACAGRAPFIHKCRCGAGCVFRLCLQV